MQISKDITFNCGHTTPATLNSDVPEAWSEAQRQHFWNFISTLPCGDCQMKDIEGSPRITLEELDEYLNERDSRSVGLD